MHFNELPDTARVWIYLSCRELTEKEVQLIRERGNEFVDSWSAHETPLKAAVDVFYNLFLVFFVDENNMIASGCSIDKSVNFIQLLEKEFGLTFLDRKFVALREKGHIRVKNMENLLSGHSPIDPHTGILFNTLVTTKAELINSFEIPLADSWLGKMMNIRINEPV